MSLGEAFIEVRADLRPFGRDLQRNLKPIVAAFEKQLKGALQNVAIGSVGSEDSGRQIGDRLSRGIKNSFTHQFKSKNTFIAIAAALGSALDDGISALPTEVKAALVLGIALAAPILGAFLTGLLVASVGAAVAGLGALLASQYQSVQDKASETFRLIRRDLVGLADDFEPAVLQALDMIRSRMLGLGDLWEAIFDVSAGFVEPLTQGFLDGLQEFVESLRRSIGDIRPFVDELGVSFAVIGDAIGKALEILTRSGDDGVTALRDLAAIIGILIVSTSALLLAFTKLYGVIRDVVHILNGALGGLSIPLAVLDGFFKRIDERSTEYRSFINSNFDLDSSFRGLVVSTKDETKAIEDYQKALEDASKAVKNQLELNISWEESLDRIATALSKNGDTLDITTDKGQENAREFLRALEIAEERAVEQVRTGQMTADQAVVFYDQQIGKLRQLATQAGLSQTEFDALFQSIIETSALRISSQEIGVDALTGELTDANSEASRLYGLLQLIMNLRRNIGAGAVAGVRGFKDGGMHYLPETINVAEDGPEVTIPLTKPARAASLMRESGLSNMFSNNSATQVLVFIGNEQLEGRMVRVAQRNNNAQAMALNNGGRQF